MQCWYRDAGSAKNCSLGKLFAMIQKRSMNGAWVDYTSLFVIDGLGTDR